MGWRGKGGMRVKRGRQSVEEDRGTARARALSSDVLFILVIFFIMLFKRNVPFLIFSVIIYGFKPCVSNTSLQLTFL